MPAGPERWVRGAGEGDLGSGGKGKTERGRRKWEPKKEVRNCGGGSRPWKRRGKGEARMECLHFREGRARPTPDSGRCSQRLGRGPQVDRGGGAVPGGVGSQRPGSYLNRSCPAVSQSCSFILLPGSISSRREKKSTPTVGSQAGERSPGKRPWVKRCRRHDFPTVESPMTMRRNW